MWNARLDESQAAIKIAMRNINNLRCTDDTILMAESEEELKSLLMRVKEEREKFNSQKTKIMAFGPNPSWQTEGGKVEAVTDFIFLGSKITANGNWSHDIKMLALWKESYGKTRQLIKKQRHHCVYKGPYSQSYHLSSSHIWIWEMIHKKAEHGRTNAFKLWC